MSDVPDLLQLDELGGGRYQVHHPSESAEGRDVVFSGQLIAQMIMASDRTVEGKKDVKSVHALFARPGSYTMPIELEVDVMQSGRTWASQTVTATQNGKLLSRGLVLMSIDDPDLMRHETAMPEVDGPGKATAVASLAYPGAEVRKVDAPDATVDGVPAMWQWVRVPGTSGPTAVHHAVLSWCTPGPIIELSMRPHADKVRIGDAHRSVSTGVIGHTINFHERLDIGEWTLIGFESTYTGRGRVHGRGLAFSEDGRLLASFSQDSMVRAVDGELDFRRAM